ncbi:MAG: SdpI family protein [Eubacterium sp.]|nr:SdpI family protein [Eubacterium sp.]
MKVNHKRGNRQWILSSILCLLPLFVSVLLYEKLPEQMAVHWNMAGEANGFLTKRVGAWIVPVFLFGIHLAVLVQAERGDADRQAARMTKLLCMWLIPVVSVMLVPASLYLAAGYQLEMNRIVLSVIGVLFVVTGNYLPKNMQNSGIGYKLPWALADADNWNKTHRLAGKAWVAAGFLLLIFAMTGGGTGWLLMGICLAVLLLPAGYSFFLYQR